jgi:hypothetical protein
MLPTECQVTLSGKGWVHPDWNLLGASALLMRLYEPRTDPIPLAPSTLETAGAGGSGADSDSLILLTLLPLLIRLSTVSSAGLPADGPFTTLGEHNGSLSVYAIKIKTFNNGSLGSGIDEERSEMR